MLFLVKEGLACVLLLPLLGDLALDKRLDYCAYSSEWLVHPANKLPWCHVVEEQTARHLGKEKRSREHGMIRRSKFIYDALVARACVFKRTAFNAYAAEIGATLGFAPWL